SCQPKSAKYFLSSASLALLNAISRMAFARSVHTTAKNLPAHNPTVTKRSSPCLGDGDEDTGRPSNNRRVHQIEAVYAQINRTFFFIPLEVHNPFYQHLSKKQK